jgi:hypothetical protein
VVVTETARPGKAGALGKVTNPSTAKEAEHQLHRDSPGAAGRHRREIRKCRREHAERGRARADYAIAANSAVRRASIVCVSTVCSSATKMLASPEVEFIVPTKGDDARRRYICHRHA